jgi:hypothetical protein
VCGDRPKIRQRLVRRIRERIRSLATHCRKSRPASSVYVRASRRSIPIGFGPIRRPWSARHR